jgi:hypothetical protein
MEASEMCDVLHYYFESDTAPTWEHGTEVKDNMRTTLYRDLYGKEYKYAVSSSVPRSASWDGAGPPPAESSIYDAAEGEIKPYFPASTEEELFDILGAPLGE